MKLPVFWSFTPLWVLLCSWVQQNPCTVGQTITFYDQSTLNLQGEDCDSDPPCRTFRGIRYANAKRFAPPKIQLLQRLGDINGNLNLVNRRPACMQDCPSNDFYCLGSHPMDEDCLFLDVTVPHGAIGPEGAFNKRRSYPVHVYFHGGALKYGNINGNYRADKWVSQSDVVMVTVAYRLGIFGFMRYGHKIPGNQGFMDQQIALEWVKSNIKHFTGRADQVTLMGHSAGAVCVSCHLISPKSTQYFSNAVLMSGSLGNPRKTIQKSEAVARKALQYPPIVVKCLLPPPTDVVTDSYMECLHSLSSKELVSAGNYGSTKSLEADLFNALHSFDITVDNNLVAEDCWTALYRGGYNHIPKSVSVIMGNVNYEGSLLGLAPFASTLYNPFVFCGLLYALFGDQVLRALQLYFPYSISKVPDAPLQVKNISSLVNAGVNADGAVQELFGDYVYVCPARALARSLAKEPHNKVYLYAKNIENNWPNAMRNLRYKCARGDAFCELYKLHCGYLHRQCHEEDMFTLFHHVNIPGYSFDDALVEGDKAIYQYFRNFAANSDPNKRPRNNGEEESSSYWKQYNAPGVADNWQELGSSKPHSIYGFRSEHCDLWDSVVKEYNLTWQEFIARNSPKMKFMQSVLPSNWIKALEDPLSSGLFLGK